MLRCFEPKQNGNFFEFFCGHLLWWTHLVKPVYKVKHGLLKPFLFSPSVLNRMTKRKERRRSELGSSRPQLKAKRKRVSFVVLNRYQLISVKQILFVLNFERFDPSKGFMTPARKKKLRVSSDFQECLSMNRDQLITTISHSY